MVRGEPNSKLYVHYLYGATRDCAGISVLKDLLLFYTTAFPWEVQAFIGQDDDSYFCQRSEWVITLTLQKCMLGKIPTIVSLRLFFLPGNSAEEVSASSSLCTAALATSTCPISPFLVRSSNLAQILASFGGLIIGDLQCLCNAGWLSLSQTAWDRKLSRVQIFWILE